MLTPDAPLAEADFSIADRPTLDKTPITNGAELRVRLEQISQVAQWSASLTGKCLFNQQVLYANINQLTHELSELRPQIESAAHSLSTIEAIELRLQEVSGKQLNELDIEKIRSDIQDAIAAGKTIARHFSELEKLKVGLNAIVEAMGIRKRHEADTNALEAIDSISLRRSSLPDYQRREMDRICTTNNHISPETQRLLDA